MQADDDPRRASVRAPGAHSVATRHVNVGKKFVSQARYAILVVASGSTQFRVCGWVKLDGSGACAVTQDDRNFAFAIDDLTLVRCPIALLTIGHGAVARHQMKTAAY
jgi:hypothetical protein